MIVVDPKGNLFDERRKSDRRKSKKNVEDDRRKGKDRRTDEWVKELLMDDNDNQKETQEEN